ncbi:MAG: hypothetical protein ACREOZ_04405 [Gloeomargaritales cyanobacterium]
MDVHVHRTLREMQEKSLFSVNVQLDIGNQPNLMKQTEIESQHSGESSNDFEKVNRLLFWCFFC